MRSFAIPLSVLVAGLLAAGGYGLLPSSKPMVAGPIRISVQPQAVLIQAAEHAQTLDFDFVVENQGPQPLGLDGIELVARDAAGLPIVRRSIGSNDLATGGVRMPGRELAPGAKVALLNPFHQFPPEADLKRLDYRFTFSIPKRQELQSSGAVTVEPRRYTSKTALALPLRGRILVQEGSVLEAPQAGPDTHHPAAPPRTGVAVDSPRYGIDLDTAGSDFEPHKGSGTANADWYAWEQPLYAPGDGVVVAARDAEPDNERGGRGADGKSLRADPMRSYGNYLVIDHGNGEFSLLGSLRQGSVAVKEGDRVARGQAVARVGNSGSSNSPHVHYELRTGAGWEVQGLPATFRNYTRHLGGLTRTVKAGTVRAGDLLEVR